MRVYGRVTGSVNQYVKVGQATKLFRSKLHKFTTVKTPRRQTVASVRSCNWFCKSVLKGKVKILLDYFTGDITQTVI